MEPQSCAHPQGLGLVPTQVPTQPSGDRVPTARLLCAWGQSTTDKHKRAFEKYTLLTTRWLRTAGLTLVSLRAPHTPFKIPVDPKELSFMFTMVEVKTENFLSHLIHLKIIINVIER